MHFDLLKMLTWNFFENLMYFMIQSMKRWICSIQYNVNQEVKVSCRRLHHIPLPLAVGDRGPHLTQCSLGPQECSPQIESWSVQPFCTVDPRDRQTDTQTLQTSVTTVCISSIRCSLKGILQNHSNWPVAQARCEYVCLVLWLTRSTSTMSICVSRSVTYP